MQDQRRKIIIAEIETWRKNHLLPEHYCIFLLNLYTEGDRPAVTGKAGDRRAGGMGGDETAAGYGLEAGGSAAYSSISWKMILSWFVGASVITGFILLAFHFNGFAPPMQIAVLLGTAGFFYLLALLFRRRAPVFTHLGLGAAFLVLILGGVFIIQKQGLPLSTLLMFLLIVCLMWIVNGLMFRFSYLLYCGVLGLGALYGVVTTGRAQADYHWWLVELYWLPLAVLMIGSGFLLKERQRQIAAVLAFCGLIYLFGPEISSLYIPEARRDVVQLLLFVKVFLGSALFFLTRRTWFEWLRL